MNREPISIPEFNETIENGYPNNDIMPFTGLNETGKTTFGVHFLYWTVVNDAEPAVCTTVKETHRNYRYDPYRKSILRKYDAKGCKT